MEFVSLLGLLLPTSLSSNAVFLSPSDLPVVILRALGKDRYVVRSDVEAPHLLPACPLSSHSMALCLRCLTCSHSSACGYIIRQQ